MGYVSLSASREVGCQRVRKRQASNDRRTMLQGGSPMRTRFAAQLAALALILTAVPFMAHHSFDGEYDRNKTVSLVGKMVDVEWVNPHCRVMILVMNSDGTKTVWR